MENKILEGLNKEQREAVTHKQGPLLIIAGAGTGKTMVITRRISWLLSEGLAKTSEILALTFTDKASQAMQERVDILLPYGYTDIWISTFHAFGDKILRENAVIAGLNPDFKVLTQAEAAVFFREHLFEFNLTYFRPLSDPTRFIEALISFFSRAKDEDISPEEYLKYAQSLAIKAKENPEDKALEEEALQQIEIAGAYLKYQELLAKEGLLDFGNQFYLSLKLLREHPLILKKYQQQFKYILVDEFQDTNFAQFQIIKLLAGAHKNITVVADDDQCVVAGTLIETPEGRKKIENIKRGDLVLTAVGKGHLATSKVTNVFKRRKKTRLLTFETEKSNKITVTSNHKMFCYVPVKLKNKEKKIYYVYLMLRKDLGWRLGITDDLAVRLKLERSADKIIGLRSFDTEQEAQFFETFLSLKYSIPTVCFMKRKGVRIVDDWLKRLYTEFNTEESVRKLAKDLDIDLDYHHYCLGAVTRGNKIRIKINVYLCYRRHISKERKNRILKNPSIMHQVSLETSDIQTITKLRKLGFNLRKAKKGFRVRYDLADIKKIEDIAFKLKEITGGILEYKFSLGKFNVVNLPALVIPASNILRGHYLPVRKENSIIYDRIVGIREKETTATVYDLEIGRTHNFIANKIVVHNCIYRFRGAAYSNLLNFIKDFPESKKVSIVQNYRSTQAILDSAYRLIQQNNPERFEVKAGINKQLVGVTKGGKAPEHLHFDTHSTEADQVAGLIKEKMKSGDSHYRDFAILVRSNSDARAFLQALNMQDIPWQFSGNQGLYSREEVKLCINFLRVAANPSDSLSLYYLVSSEAYNFNLSELTVISHYSKRRNKPLYLVFQDIGNIEELEVTSDATKEKIKNILSDLEKFLKTSRQETTGKLLYSFLTETGYLKSLTQNQNLENETKIQNLAKFFNIVRDFELVAKEDRVISFVNYLNLLIEAGDDPSTVQADLDSDAVNVLTIHKAKGLEFRVVFLVSLVQGRFPWPRRAQTFELPDIMIKEVLPTGDFHIQEERRLFYVGMTRAKEELYLTSAADYGGSRLRKVSQFVAEALGKEMPAVEKKKTSAREAIERFALKKESLPSAQQIFPEGKLVNLSYYHIDDYLTCPLKYKYVNILRVPIMEHHTVIYGRAMHDAVSKYFQFKLINKKMSLADLLNAFRVSFDPQGFLSEKHQQERRSTGEKALIRFFEEEEKLAARPKFIEKEFSFILEDNKISGRFDRVDEDKDGAIIMDFKTSQIKTHKDADKRAAESLQLKLYALAYQRMSGSLPKSVALYFLESGMVGKSSIGEDDLEEIKEKIKEVSAGIRKGNFSAAPAYMGCAYCAYNQICPSVLIK
ncbi:MAG: UvrD-helicase domain-containing protein [Candidatus Omnitrophica bacterium]|jgi:DNA helicase-2/ATP-dependent DNA helicase PcrA|nr:UvrD-helicase domain-containing protein [Candidatus Omnitrophota bacterium]